MSEALPDGWQWASLSELVTPHGEMCDGDWVESKDQDPSGDVRLIQLADVGSGVFLDKSERYLTTPKARKLNCTFLKPCDVLISRLGEPLGKTCLFPELEQPCVTVVDVHIFRSGSADVSHQWLARVLNSASVRRRIEAQSSGTTRKRITGKKLKGLKIPVPPALEQKRIASRIDELFSRIEEGERALERVQRLVERYRQSVLKAAVTGELTREWREKHKGKLESGEALLARILKARREAWEKSELGKMKAKGQKPANDNWKRKYKEPVPPVTSDLPELPEGWVWASPIQLQAHVPNALTIGPFGSNLKVSDYVQTGVPLIFVRNIRAREFGDTGSKFVSPLKATELSSHVVRAGDVLITKMGDPPGDACVYPLGSPDAIITADCIKWTLSALLPNHDYFAMFINSHLGRFQIAEITKGVAQQKVSLDRFRQIAIAVPGPEEQARIANEIEVEYQHLADVELAILLERRRSVAARQSILKAAFSGYLVPQVPDDEPASILLERIAAERNGTSKNGTPKRGRKKKVTA